MQEWPVYAADAAATHYSPLADIDAATSRSSRSPGSGRPARRVTAPAGARPGIFEDTPLMIDDVLYVSTPYNRVVALDAETGAQKLWSFDPKAYEDGQPPNGTGLRASRRRRVARRRQLRIFLNSRAKLICLDAKTGQPVETFGDHGVVDLTQGLRWAVDPKRYTNTSPPVVYKDLVILGNGVGDRLTYRQDPPGDVRAFDARTGKQVWSFHTVPERGRGRRRDVGRRLVEDHRATRTCGRR